jgi:hypothetical protein
MSINKLDIFHVLQFHWLQRQTVYNFPQYRETAPAGERYGHGFPGGLREDWGSGLVAGQETKTGVDSLRYWNEIAINASGIDDREAIRVLARPEPAPAIPQPSEWQKEERVCAQN